MRGRTLDRTDRVLLVGFFVASIASLLIAPAAMGAAPAKDKATERAWRAKCASCHGADGSGQTDQGKKMGVGDMRTAAWQREFSDEKMKVTIRDGFKRQKNGKAQEMEAFGSKLKPEQIDALVGYVRGLAR